MRISAESFWAPKAGNKESEYEDAFWPATTLWSEEGTHFRFAIADGATDSVFSGVWARILTRAFYNRRIDLGAPEVQLSYLRRMWSRSIKRQGLPWYTLTKLEAGAFATLLGVALVENGTKGAGNWSAVATGDSCLFHLRDDRLLQCFPITESSAFNSSPLLLSSIAANDEGNLLQTQDGRWEAGDTFYLMTDAAACWFLKTQESGKLAWRFLRDLRADDGDTVGFRSWLTEMRQSRAIKNDDVTISRIEIERD